MKKILLFAPTAPASGITQFILNYVNQMDLSEFCFDIVSYKNNRLKSWTEEHGFQYFELNVSLYKHPKLYKELLCGIFSGGYSTVHFHCSAITDLRQFQYAKTCGINNIIIHSHTTQFDVTSKARRLIFGTVHTILRDKAAGYANHLCACSQSAALWLFGKRYYKKAVIVNNAIDLSKFTYSEQIHNQKRTELGIDPSDFVIGHIGRFSYQKNHEFIIDVFQTILKEKPNAKLLLVGEGELKDLVKEKVKQTGIADKVIFFSFNPDIAQFYQAMDCFILPSHFEGFGIVLIEAQATGLTCFASKGAVPEFTNAAGLVHFISLDQPAEVWAKEILNTGLSDRPDTHTMLTSAGFDSKTLVKIMQQLYTQ